MRTALIVMLLIGIAITTYSQNITNTLAPGGKFIVKDAANDYLTLDQETGKTILLRSLVLGNTIDSNSGVIFKGTERFIHNRGPNNTFIGINSGNFTMTGGGNTANGNYTLSSNTTGSQNIAIGYYSLYSNTTGTHNTACGYSVLTSNTTGGSNTAIGYNSLIINSTGNSNTSSGIFSLSSNTTGSYNTASGQDALYSNTTGSYNSAFGTDAYPNSGTLSNYTAIGYYTGGASSTSNRVEIGNTSVTWIGGNVGWSIYSDERIKENISDNVPGLAFITKLRPVTYNLNIHKQNEIMYKGKENQGEWDSKYDIEKIRMTGFLAQEVEKAAQEVNYNFNGVEKSKNEDGLYSLRYSEFVMPLVKAVQEQQIIIETLTKRIEELEKR